MVLCKECNWDGVDVFIIGGDFQVVCNVDDLIVMFILVKYCELGDFFDYYSGKRKVFYFIIFVVGNYEVVFYLVELYYGGWVVLNIYYMGVVNIF